MVDNRTERITVRLKPKEYLELQKILEVEDLKVSEFVRLLISEKIKEEQQKANEFNRRKEDKKD